MIFVTVGNNSFQFDRLIMAVDQLVQKYDFEENIVMQIGACSYVPKFGKYFRYCSKEQLEEYILKSSLVISHGGIGSLFYSIKNHKKTIAIARLAEFKEHANNHQLEIIQKLSNDGLLLGSSCAEDLEKFYVAAKDKTFNFHSEQHYLEIIAIIKSIIDA